MHSKQQLWWSACDSIIRPAGGVWNVCGGAFYSGRDMTVLATMFEITGIHRYLLI
jgi:hypothetical protein